MSITEHTVSTALDVVCEVLLNESPAFPESEESRDVLVGASIGIESDCSYRIEFFAHSDIARVVAAGLFGILPSMVTPEEESEAMKEAVNMIGGQIKAQANPGGDLSLPVEIPCSSNELPPSEEHRLVDASQTRRGRRICVRVFTSPRCEV